MHSVDAIRHVFFSVGVRLLVSCFGASDDTMTASETAIFMLYGKPQHELVNALRCGMFGSKSTDPPKLTPCQNAVRCH